MTEGCCANKLLISHSAHPWTRSFFPPLFSICLFLPTQSVKVHSIFYVFIHSLYVCSPRVFFNGTFIFIFRYSAVVRPGEQPPGGMAGGKYVPPMLRKKNQNGGKLLRSTPPPTGARYNCHGGSNPPTPTSSSYSGPPQASSANHSPVGSVAGAPPAYPPQQQPQLPTTHTPSPTAHPPLHRNNSQGAHHTHPPETKVNGDAKGSYGKFSNLWLSSSYLNTNDVVVYRFMEVVCNLWLLDGNGPHNLLFDSLLLSLERNYSRIRWKLWKESA